MSSKTATSSNLLAYLLGALLFAIPAAAVDAGWTIWTQPARPFDWGLLWSTLLAHGILAILLGVPSYFSLRRWLRRRSIAVDERAGFAVVGACYLFLFGSFYHLVDLVGNRHGLGRILSPKVIGLELLLLAGSILFAWLVTRGRSGIAPGGRRSKKYAGVLFLTVLCSSVLAWGVLFLMRGGIQGEEEARAPAYSGKRLRNVLWIVMDTTRRDRTTVYDPSLDTTPRLAKFAQDGVVFENASSAASFTLTSHASMLTGQHPSRHGATHATPRFRSQNPSLAVELQRAGMRTAAFMSNHVLSSESGINIGFDHYDDMVDPQICHTSIWDVVHNVQATCLLFIKALRNNGQPHWFEDHQRPAAAQNERIFDWLDENGDEPFFLFVNYYDVHWPYLPEEPYRARFAIPYTGPITGFVERDDDFDPERGFTEEDHRYLLSLYDAELAYLDDQVGALLDRVQALGYLEETLVVITSDHGEHFGERGMVGHTRLYEPSLAVPLIMRLPGALPAGSRVEVAVQAADLAPTVLELVGLKIPRQMQGRSLLARIRDSDVPSLPVIAEDNYHALSSTKMARIGSLKLLVGFGERAGEEELYDLSLDPTESRNLLATGEVLSKEDAATLPLLRSAIDELPVNMPAQGDASSAENRHMQRALEALGYVE